MFSMGRHVARREVAEAWSWVDKVRFVGRNGWPEVAEWYNAQATYEETLEAAEVAFEQAEERLATELMSSRIHAVGVMGRPP
jgi:hypothetical protein